MEELRSKGEEESVVMRYDRRRVPNGRIDSGGLRDSVGVPEVEIAATDSSSDVAPACVGVLSWILRLLWTYLAPGFNRRRKRGWKDEAGSRRAA